MLQPILLRCAFIVLIIGYNTEGTACTLTFVPNSVRDGVLTVCPGDFIAITCTHNNVTSGVTRWVVSDTPSANCSVTVSHDSPVDTSCGLLNITMISGSTGPTVSSTAQTTATEALDGALVQCFFSSGNSPQAVTIQLRDIPLPTVSSVSQLSQSMIEVSLAVADPNQCMGSWGVIAVRSGQNESDAANGLSTTSTVQVDGLDVCRFSYIVSGYIVTPGGVRGNTGTTNVFLPDLSKVPFRVENLGTRHEGTVLEWKYQVNPLYPTCVIGFSVAWEEGSYSINDGDSTSVSNSLLTGFPFCEAVIIALYPLPPTRSTSIAACATVILNFPPPDISREYRLLHLYDVVTVEETVGNVTMNVTQLVPIKIIQLRVLVQTISTSIVPERTYGVSLAGRTCTTHTEFSGSSIFYNLPRDTAPGDVVTACVRFTNHNCTDEFASKDFTIPGPDITVLDERLTSPTSYTITLGLPLTDDLASTLIIISTLTPNDTAPVTVDFPTSYQYPLTFTDLTPNADYNYTVRIVLNFRMDIEVATFTGSFSTVPPITTATPTTTPTTIPVTTAISSVGQQVCYQVTFPLPEVPHLPEELVIISSLTPEDVEPMISKFTESSSQHTTAYCNLSPGVEYSYTIRIVLHSNTSVDVADPVTGSFILTVPTSSTLSAEASVGLTFALTFLLTLVLGVSIGVLSVLGYEKCKTSSQSSPPTETEMKTPAANVYEESEDIKPDSRTQENPA